MNQTLLNVLFFIIKYRELYDYVVKLNPSDTDYLQQKVKILNYEAKIIKERNYDYLIWGNYIIY